MKSILFLIAVVFAFQTRAGEHLSINEAQFRFMNQENFAEFLTYAKTQGIETVTIDNTSPRAQKVGLVDDSYPGGDAFLMQGLIPEKAKDHEMRLKEYKDFFAIVDYLSWRRFRVTINLHAATDALYAAINNNRPTIVIWSSHGNEQYFYGADDEAIPHTVFTKTSPTFYQFILSSCHGRTALDKHYLPAAKNTDFLTIGWKGLTNSDELKAYLMSSEWNIYKNRANFPNQGFVCEKAGQGQYHVKVVATGKVLEVEKDGENCQAQVMHARHSFICIKDSAGTRIYSALTGEPVWGATYEQIKECYQRLPRAHDQRVCRGNGKGAYRIVDARQIEPVSPVYDNLKKCEADLYTQQSL